MTPGWIDVEAMDRLPPFLVSVVSPSEHWLYASSRGGMTGGRVRAEDSLFPYLTDDRLHRAQEDVGGWTCLHVQRDGVTTPWEPFRTRSQPHLRRRLRKSVVGDRLVYEEANDSLGLTFSVQWAFSERFGIVRSATLSVHEGSPGATVRVADGLNGVLPAGVPLGLVQTASNLVDAYGRAEWDAEGELALFTLESLPTDRAEPAEGLRANVAWCEGLSVEAVLLGRDQLDGVALGQAARHEPLVTGRPGAFVVTSTVDVAPDAPRTWHIVADVSRSHVDVSVLRTRERSNLGDVLQAELDATTAALEGIVADVDGLQRTADPVLDAHQRASALFNAMRGGVPVREHRIVAADFARFVAARNAPCHARNADWLGSLDSELEVGDLLARARERGDADLERLVFERLPLWFGRRHGDPSRPWNTFEVLVRNDDGSRRVHWQGNWRDVFQNWEALLLAYPEFLESVVAVFVNASTLDGYNPYRVTSDGIDWEVPEPENPWANIGYWGDHQVNYLTRLLELSMAHHPGRLEALLHREVFSSADVPYRLRSYDDLVADPRDAIVFDHARQAIVEAREARVGADGRRVHEDDQVLHLDLAQKLVLPVLAKLSALVPGAGIWLNTQRPEWNDANNALAGYGVSVVTTAYLRRHLTVLRDLFTGLGDTVVMTSPGADWLDATLAVLADAPPATWTPEARRAVMDQLGRAAETYRDVLYSGEPLGRATRDRSAYLDLCERGLVWLDDALARARRPDGLFDGYDLVSFGPGTAEVERLYPMLEGQVAVLSSRVLSPEDAAELLERMFDGPLFRHDVRTFMLYPNRDLPSFLTKNQVPEPSALAIPSVRSWLRGGGSPVLARDAEGTLRFGADLRNAEDLAQLLDRLGVVDPDRAGLLALWEETFNHAAFTGRSGTMHAYEGIGSVYWHMVGKLLLAAQEAWRSAVDQGADPAVIARLTDLYGRVRDGLGFNRTPAEFGAIPTDPYSHTPLGRGAQQPGMTGLVKEELLTRRGELGVCVEAGRLRFAPELLDPSERVVEATTWTIPAGVRPSRTVQIPPAGLAFLLCGVPVVYREGSEVRVQVYTDEGVVEQSGSVLSEEMSARVFSRDTRIDRIEVVTLRR